MILGCNFLHTFGVVLDFDTNNIICDGISLPMREFPTATDKANTIEVLLHNLLDHIMDNDGDSSLNNMYAININESKYDAADPVKIAESCTHLTKEQCKNLTNLPTKFLKLFNNELKSFTDEKIYLDIDPTVTPHHSCPYAVPQAHMTTFKKELNQLVSIGVLEKCGCADWVAGTFIIPKKDGWVQWVSDFCALNKAIK